MNGQLNEQRTDPLPGHARRMIELWEQRSRPRAPPPRQPSPTPPSITTRGVPCLCSCHFEPVTFARRPVRQWPMSPPPLTPPPSPAVAMDSIQARMQQPARRAAAHMLSRLPVPVRMRPRVPAPDFKPHNRVP